MMPLFSITGKVIRGNQLGIRIGYPTANIYLEHPESYHHLTGVYAAQVDVDGKWYSGMANIGFRPTLSPPSFSVEVHLFGFTEMIYEKLLTIHFISRIRDEYTFDSWEALKKQIAIDQTAAKEILSVSDQPDTNSK